MDGEKFKTEIVRIQRELEKLYERIEPQLEESPYLDGLICGMFRSTTNLLQLQKDDRILMYLTSTDEKNSRH